MVTEIKSPTYPESVADGTIATANIADDAINTFVNKIGGFIEAESSNNQTSFKIFLPDASQ